MSFDANVDPRIKGVLVTEDLVTFDLVDGRILSVPLAWSWRLSTATPEQRARFEIIGDGQGVHWPDVDEDLSAQGILTGTPARRLAFEDDRDIQVRCQRVVGDRG
jgi:hypothetical protein